jgi:hypothetical protein
MARVSKWNKTQFIQVQVFPLSKKEQLVCGDKYYPAYWCNDPHRLVGDREIVDLTINGILFCTWCSF